MSTNFGKDTSCTDSLKPGRYATGAQLVGEAVYRRLITPRGMLRGGEDEANYGLDLTEFVGSTSTKQDAAAAASRIKAELKKDERIIDVVVEVTPSTEGPETYFEVTINAETTEGPFDLQIGVSDVNVEILGLEAS